MPCYARCWASSSAGCGWCRSGLIRVNLGQEAISLAVNSSPDELFTEPTLLADALCEQFRRYVPLIEG